MLRPTDKLALDTKNYTLPSPSIRALEERLAVQEKQAGSLYGLKERVVFSDETSIDEVIDRVMEAIAK